MKRGGLLLKLGRPAEAQAELLCARAIPGRDPATSSNCVDLSLHYTAALHEDWHGEKIVRNNLAALPTGRQLLDGVEFDVRGIVQLGSRQLDQHAPGYPLAVTSSAPAPTTASIRSPR